MGSALEVRCRSERCRAPILWARTAAGEPMPVDVDPSPDGELDLVDGRVYPYGLEAAAAKRPRYRAHWASCPDADDFRRAGGGRPRRRR
ncbi:MAG: hypothetical protein KC464_17185 [Myxococcales bacterium]|nr:hypothetical protein [Myxococcales bacterium]